MRSDGLSTFSLVAWLASQDVTDRDETLDERCARVHALHQALVKPDEGVVLARRISDGDVATVVRDIVLLVDSDEPRFGAMVLVDLVGALREGRDEEDGRRLRDSMAAISRAIPLLFLTIDKRARKGDVCEDTMSYSLTLLSFLLAGDNILSDAERAVLRNAVVDTTWLKASMRLWKEADILGHVPGSDTPDYHLGLGAVVTMFLHHVVQGGEAVLDSDMSGARALAKLGSWAVSHIVMRLYDSNIGGAERKRLIDVTYACCACDSSFFNLIFDDANILQAVCDSASSFILTHSELERFDEEEGGCESEEVATRVVARTIQNCTGAFAHLRLLQLACQDGERSVDRQLQFFRLCGSNFWFWKAVGMCAKYLDEASSYNSRHGKSCYDLWVAPCCIAMLSNILWGIMKWLASRADSGDLTVDGSMTTTAWVLAQALRMALKLSRMTNDSLVLGCTLALGDSIKARCTAESPEPTRDSIEPRRRENLRGHDFCEFCLKSSKDIGHLMHVCSGCRHGNFCNPDHLRRHWRPAHKRACKGKASESLALFDIHVAQDGALTFGIPGVDDRIQGRSVLDARVLSLTHAVGPALASLGGGVVHRGRGEDSLDNDTAQVRYLPRGKLLASLKLATAEEDVVAAMARVCAERVSDTVLIACCSPNSAQTLSLCRVSGPKDTCKHFGCPGHAVCCSAYVSGCD